MKIPANKCIMTIRYVQYRNIDFIKEHDELISEYGSAHMLKVGRKIPQSSLENVSKESGMIILKAPKVAGGQYYLASFSYFHNGDPLPDFHYPRYYSEMITSQREYDFTLDGTWFEIKRVKRIPDYALDHVKMQKSGKLLKEVIESTRTSTMYVICDTDLNI